MRVLVLGSGGREQAIAWACREAGHDVAKLATAPDDDTLRSHDLVIPGPETLLADGLADRCAELGVACFGPTADLARLETSKGHSRDLAVALGIPGPAHVRFAAGDADGALAWWRALAAPVVVKFDGLAAGKGVEVPDGDAATEAAIIDMADRGAFVLEERMTGPECSLLALCDGRRAVALPLAQDHKRIGEGDTGPNTGGMGAYAPAALDPDPNLAPERLLDVFVQPVLDHLAAAGTPYIGVLYAGLMITSDGPRLVEYNCRFGDPETQAVLPLLDSDRVDLATIAAACTRGALDTVIDTVCDGARVLPTAGAASCCVVAAADGYPGTPRTGMPVLAVGFAGVTAADRSVDDPDTVLFPAGVDADGLVSGGRVLAVTGVGADLAEARSRAYLALDGIAFDGMTYRRDIAWRAPGVTLRSYAAAGVDIAEGTRAVERMRTDVERTLTPAVLRGVGSFGGVIDLSAAAGMTEPVLVASTDGVGTKVELAARLGRVRSVGMDIVNHCIDDVLVQSARPLFFLDYIAASVLDADVVADVVSGMAEACSAAGCALLGGETAEMPGVYAPGAFDVAGTLVGIAERARLLPRDDIAAGHVLIGLASSGPHTNGYSFLRRLFEWFPMDATPAGLDRPLGEALLEPHRSYLDVLGPLLDSPAGTAVAALAHITGGGLPENLPRVLPDGVDARIHLGSWPTPPLFALVRDLAVGVDTEELHTILNMGIGMVIVCPPDRAREVRDAIAEETWIIGELVPGTPGGRRVILES
jgi:phosphoribosylaminoimidazole synthetase/phosphoribosylamine--glycine ligase